MNNIAIPDQPDSYKHIAEEVLETLNACIHWFRIPSKPEHREAMVRRWASAIRDMNLTRELAHKATQRYLDKRWAKDPIPEPRDVFTIPDKTLEEWGGHDKATVHLRRYLTVANNRGWQEYKKNPQPRPRDGHTSALPDAFTWKYCTGGTVPLTEEIINTLRAIGEPELAALNQQLLNN